MRKVHFIAIGGAVMHNLALALHKKGIIVSGSDDEIREPSRSRLAAAGLLPAEEGWFTNKITPELDAVILGMHARKDNPELLRAHELNIAVYSFPEFLFQQTEDKLRVVIAGSHGKTTITSMVMHVLKSCGKDFDYMVGAGIEGFDTMVKLTREAPLAVFEGDEYLSSPLDPRPKFHLYHPRLALISGIAWDHINVFPTKEIYEEQFVSFIRMMTEGSVLVWYAGDETLSKLVKQHGNHLRTISYNLPEYSIVDNKTLVKHGESATELQVFGRHNLQNMEGARLICDELGVGVNEFYHAMKEFKGAARRLEKIAENSGAVIFRDFAHSPSKLKATVEAVKQQYPERRVTAVMELHTFSSLNANFLTEYRNCMAQADEAIVYFNPKTIAHKKLEPVAPEDVQAAFGQVEVYTDATALQDKILSGDFSNNVLLLMSSGTFDGLDLKKVSAKTEFLNT